MIFIKGAIVLFIFASVSTSKYKFVCRGTLEGYAIRAVTP
jgi:hypothetical protein